MQVIQVIQAMKVVTVLKVLRVTNVMKAKKVMKVMTVMKVIMDTKVFFYILGSYKNRNNNMTLRVFSNKKDFLDTL